MEIINVLAAAASAYVFGAIWYSFWGKTWMQAAEISLEDIKGPDGKQSPMPFIISAICVIIVAGMMRHLFAMAGIEEAGKGLLTGFGIGLFIVSPWIATNYAYGMRRRNLTLLDGGYATIGCTLMGLVLTLF